MRYIFVTYAIYATYILHVMQSMYAIYAMFTICNISNILNIQLFHCLHDMYTINLNLNWYIFPLSRARRAQRHPLTYPHSPNCWHDIGNTNVNNKLNIISPNCWHNIYNINVNINWHTTPLPRARRAHRHPPTYPHSPNCWHEIVNTNENNNLHITPPIVGTICTILM